MSTTASFSGLQPPRAELGLMVTETFPFYDVAPWLAIAMTKKAARCPRRLSTRESSSPNLNINQVYLLSLYYESFWPCPCFLSPACQNSRAVIAIATGPYRVRAC
jgi:hypothetical protein